MNDKRITRSASVVRTGGLAVALAVLVAPIAVAQSLGSGSGSGTGTGQSGGSTRNTTGTGMESGAGNSTGTGNESGAGPNRLPSNRQLLPAPNNRPGSSETSPAGSQAAGAGGNRSATSSVPLGPGVDTTFPGETSALPGNGGTSPGLGDNTVVSSVTDHNLKFAQGIESPGDRSLALSRVASAATFSSQLDLAEKALFESASAAELMPQGLVRDQRLISIIAALMNLAEANLREGRSDTPSAPAADLNDPGNEINARRPKSDRDQMIRLAQGNWRRASELSQRISNPTYKTELMYRVCDSLSYGSQTIVNEFPRPDGGSQHDAAGLVNAFAGLPDQLLVDAAVLAAKISRPVFHDRALALISSAAAESKQFARALSIARMIPQPEVRSDALLKIAEVQVRRSGSQEATATYQEVANSIASIPLDGPRMILAGVLVDSLISVGRFTDARAATVLYKTQERKMNALGAVAESMGRRGVSDQALAWINREVPPESRSVIYRRLNNGVIWAVEQNRGKDLSRGNDTK